MSSKSETNSKFKHLNSNVYQITTKEKVIPKAAKSSHVLKAGSFDLNGISTTLSSPSVRVEKYVPAPLSGATRATLSSNHLSRVALDEMKQNLKSLNDLQSRLRFVLKELEELVHE